MLLGSIKWCLVQKIFQVWHDLVNDVNIYVDLVCHTFITIFRIVVHGFLFSSSSMEIDCPYQMNIVTLKHILLKQILLEKYFVTMSQNN